MTKPTILQIHYLWTKGITNRRLQQTNDSSNTNNENNNEEVLLVPNDKEILVHDT